MRPYWFLRTIAGLSMDIGMTLLVINLMMTALTRSATAAARPGDYGVAPVPAGGAV
jgi:cytochrome c oxidase cbb3-type subunit 1